MECGSAFPRICLTCAAPASAKAKFCTNCGQALTIPQQTAEPLVKAPPERPVPAPVARTPRHIAERVLRARQAIEGERKSVTVLFADIKGSTSLIEHRDPEQARLVLEPIMQVMIDAVHRFDGIVSKVMGDGIMALFGAPLALEDHAVRAAHAALAVRQAAREKSADLRNSDGLEVQVRVGLNSGEVIVLGIGDDLHMDYDAIGATVHLAARMEQAAVPDTIRLSSHTAHLLAGRMRLDDLGSVPVAGFSEPVETFELIEAIEVEFLNDKLAPMPPMVGRDPELHMIRDVAERVSNGRGQAVMLTGDPGIGKTRFCAEIVRQLASKGWLCLRTQAAPYASGEPWLAIRRILRSHFELADDTRVEERIREKVCGCDPSLHAAVPGLLEIMGLPVCDAAWRALKPEERRQRILDAVSGWLSAESRQRPVLIVVDDLQWADAETETLLQAVSVLTASASILLMLVARLDYADRLAAFGSAAQIRLQPLVDAESAELLEELVRSSTHLINIKARLIERAGGNPLYLEEIVRVLNDKKTLVAETLPPSVQAIIAARIDALPSEEKTLLQAAAVLGQEFVLGHLVVTIAQDADDVRTGLSHLQAKGFLQEQRIFPEVSFGFDQPLVLEVAYRSLLKEKRCALHRSAFLAIRGSAIENGAILAGRLAHHAYEAELWEEAACCCRIAAQKAAAQTGYQEAASLYRKALTALARTAASDSRSRLEMDLRIELRHVLFPLGQFAEIGTLLTKVLEDAELLGDQQRLGLVLTLLTTHFMGAGRHREAIATGVRALAIADAVEDKAAARDVLFQLIQASASSGDYRIAVAYSRRLIETPPEGPAGVTTTSLARMWLAWCLAELGAFEEAHREVEVALEVARAANQDLPVLLAHLGGGLTSLREQRFEEAAAWLEAALRMSESPNLGAWWGAVGSPLGRAWVALGHVEEAIALLEQVVARSTSSRGSGHVLRSLHLAEAYCLAGRADEALQLAIDALELARKYGEQGHEAYALLFLGQLALEAGSEGRAIHYLQEARDVAAHLGMQPLKARVDALLAGSPGVLSAGS